MTESTHTYAAVLVGSPNVALSVKGGSVTLDDSSAPHVRASLTIAQPVQATLVALDPRQNKRVRLTATATTAGGTPTRVFDLALRSRPVRHRDGTVTLDLASDEALLQDWGPLDDDENPYNLAASLRAVVNYVLPKVISGAALASVPSTDMVATPYWAVTNLAKNPGPRASAAGYLAGTGARDVGFSPNLLGRNAVGFYATGTGAAFLNCPATGVRITAGETYTAVGEFVSATTARSVRMMMRFKDQNGTILADLYGPTVTDTTNSWTRARVTAAAPVNATQVEAYANIVSGAADQFHAVSRVMVYPGRLLIPYHDGTTGPAGYTFAWEDPANPDTTSSTRKPVTERDPEALVWKAGQSALDFLAPLLQSFGLRLVCDESRVWTLRSEDYTAADSLALSHGVNLVDAEDRISRDDDTWFDAAVTRYEWTDRDGIRQTRLDSYALATPFLKLREFVKRDTPYPGPGFSQYAVRRAQGRGREVTATTVSDWRARSEQPVSVVLNGAPIQTGRTGRVTFDLDMDEMTVTTRTTDTPATAWVLLPTGQKWTDSPVGASWTGEVV